MSSVNTSGSSLKITGGRLFDGHGAEQENTALLIRDGRIAAIGEAAARESADETISAENGVITPGFVDLCCNLREPGNGQKGNIASETLAAAHGGFTTGVRLAGDVAGERFQCRHSPDP